MIARHLKPLLSEALQHFPAIVILGSRQVGKSTLAQDLPSKAWRARYLTFDDFALLEAATRDPDGFVDGLSLPVILDEVQRVPDLLRSIKRVLDRERRPGLFLLTGSANLLTMKSVSESLAGRVALFDLYPFSLSETHGQPSPPASLEMIFSCRTAKDLVASLSGNTGHVTRSALASRMLAGGYPVPSMMKPGPARTRWFDSYRRTYLERDLRDLSRIADLLDFGRLLISLAAQSGKLLNLSSLSRDLGIPISTLRRHMSLLETTFQVWTVRPYFANIGKRLVKTPKIYLGDTGLAMNLIGDEDWESSERQGRSGWMVETWVAGELRKLAGLSAKRTDIFFWRTHGGQEVDFLLGRGERLAAIEVKWANRISDADLRGMESCRQDLEGRLGLGVILYSGETAFALSEKVAAVPLVQFFLSSP